MECRVKLVPQILKCLCFVCTLIARVLTLGHDASRDMNSSTRRVGFIYMLAACALGSVSVYPNVFHIQDKLSWNIRHHYDYSSTWMQSTCFFCLWYSLHFMNSWFVLEMFVHILARNVKSCRFTPFINADVALELKLLQFESHQSAIIFVHPY